MSLIDNNSLAKLPERLLGRTKDTGACSKRLAKLSIICLGIVDTSNLKCYQNLYEHCMDMQGNVDSLFRKQYVEGIAAYSKYNSNEDHPEGENGKK